MSGNKIRKLEVLLADALQQEANIVVTAGGIQSNHCRATAVACARLGLQCVLLQRVNGSHAASQDPGYAGNLLLSRCAGARIRLIDSGALSTADKTGQGLHAQAVMKRMVQQFATSGRNAYPIPVGGSNALGAIGYVQAAEEIMQQCSPGAGAASQPFPYTDIAVATGSGGTLAGLALGLHLAGCPARVHGLGVCDSPEYFYKYVDEHILPDMVASGCSVPSARDLFVVHDCSGLGYAQSTDDEMQTMREAMAAAQVMLDPVYTNKAVHGLLRQMKLHAGRGAGEAGVFKGGKVLFIHTGGLFGLFGQGVDHTGRVGRNGGSLFPPSGAAELGPTAGEAATPQAAKAQASLPVLQVQMGPEEPMKLDASQADVLDAPVATVILT